MADHVLGMIAPTTSLLVFMNDIVTLHKPLCHRRYMLSLSTVPPLLRWHDQLAKYGRPDMPPAWCTYLCPKCSAEAK